MSDSEHIEARTEAVQLLKQLDFPVGNYIFIFIFLLVICMYSPLGTHGLMIFVLPQYATRKMLVTVYYNDNKIFHKFRKHRYPNKKFESVAAYIFLLTSGGSFFLFKFSMQYPFSSYLIT